MKGYWINSLEIYIYPRNKENGEKKVLNALSIPHPFTATSDNQ